MGLSLGPLLCWAAEPKKPSDTKQITSSIGMKLTLVPSGEFMMGSKESAEATAAFFNKTYGANFQAEDFKGQHPQHRVRITRPFYLGVYHVTRGQFRHFVNDTGYKTDAEKGAKPGHRVGTLTRRSSASTSSIAGGTWASSRATSTPW